MPDPVASCVNQKIRFSQSLHDAFANASADGRRVLVYFTGEHCLWCRKMEAETHADAAVIDQAAKYVCVKVSKDERPDLAEKYRVYSIPRTLVLTAEDQPVDEQRGYEPPLKHHQWLQNTMGRPPSTWAEHHQRMADSGRAGSQADLEHPPAPCGAPLVDSDLVLWFVEQDAASFQDREWTAHSDLLGYLRSRGFRPRIEHLYRWQATDRWEQAANEGRLPELIVSSVRAGLLVDLMRRKLVSDVISDRLSQPDVLAVCQDFAGRSLWTVDDSPHSERAAQAVELLFAPRDGVELGSVAAMPVELREAAERTAAEAAHAWSAGDVESLKSHWHSNSPQRLASAASPEMLSRRAYQVTTAGVRLYGTDRLAIAVVETRATGSIADAAPFISHFQRIGTPSVVVLVREADEWKVLVLGLLHFDFSVRGFDFSVCDLASLLAFASSRPRAESVALPRAAIAFPANGFEFSNDDMLLRWELDGADAAGLELWYVESSNDCGWPMVSIRRLPHDGLAQVPLYIRGETTAEIWSVAADGRIVFSERVSWTFNEQGFRARVLATTVDLDAK